MSKWVWFGLGAASVSIILAGLVVVEVYRFERWLEGR